MMVVLSLQYSYEEVLEKMNSARRFGSLPGVEVTAEMLKALGHPEKGFSYIHVAGTNGKGSVCAFLSSILKKAGKRVGTFTSPHLIDFEERIVVDGAQIAKEDVTRLGNRILNMDLKVTPTMFDICLVMAILYFKEQHCEVLVIETGLGGRLDSTNALGTPAVCVLTKIGYDHTAILGNTLEKIAKEKAGIIKKGSLLVTEMQEAEAQDVIRDAYQRMNGDFGFYEVKQSDIENIKKQTLSMLGIHQWENAAAAAIAARLYLETQFGIKEHAQIIKEGLETATWRGRMEVLQENPFLLVDGAHNSHGVKALAHSLKTLYPGEKFHFIMAVMADKDYEDMIMELIPLAHDFVAVTPESERGLQAKELVDYIQEKGIIASVEKSVEECLEKLSCKKKNIAFGSLYFVGEILDKWKGLY